MCIYTQCILGFVRLCFPSKLRREIMPETGECSSSSNSFEEIWAKLGTPFFLYFNTTIFFQLPWLLIANNFEIWSYMVGDVIAVPSESRYSDVDISSSEVVVCSEITSSSPCKREWCKIIRNSDLCSASLQNKRYSLNFVNWLSTYIEPYVCRCVIRNRQTEFCWVYREGSLPFLGQTSVLVFLPCEFTDVPIVFFSNFRFAP